MLADGDLGPASHLLQNLLDETDAVKPVLISGNYLIDTLVNGRLTALSEKGAAVRVQASVPDILPLDYETVYQALQALLNTAADSCEASGIQAELTLNLDYADECLSADCTFPDTPSGSKLSRDLQPLIDAGKCRFESGKPEDGSVRVSLWLK